MSGECDVCPHARDHHIYTGYRNLQNIRLRAHHLVPRELHNLVYTPCACVSPQDQLVVSKAVRRHKLSVVDRPLDRAHLRLGIDFVQALPIASIPQANAPISRPPPRSQQICLERAPRQCLDCGLVSVDGKPSLVTSRLPDVEHIVVATRSKLRGLGTPFEATNLLRMPLQLCNTVLGCPNVVVDDYAIPAATAEHRPVPRHG